MHSLKWKCLTVIIIAVFAAVSFAGYSEAAQKKSKKSRRTPQKVSAEQKKAPATSDDIIGGEMLKLAEALKKTAQLEMNMPSSEEQREKLYEQYDAQIAKLEQEIAEIELKKDALLEAGVSDDAEIDAQLEAAQNEADDIADKLYFSFDVMPEYVNAFHPQASSQIVGWELSQDVNTEEDILLLTILHSKESQKITRLSVLSGLTDSGDIFFKIDNLPDGLQIVIPDETGSKWTVTADGRAGNRKFDSKGYFTAKIADADNIAYSALDGESNINDDGTKTFRSGEAFIILRRSGITIRSAESKR